MCIFLVLLFRLCLLIRYFFDIQQTSSYPEKYETYIFVHYCSIFILDKDWMLYGFITLGSVFSLVILAGIVCVCMKCIKILKFRYRQFRNQRQVERNPQQIGLRLLPDSVQNFSSFN